MNLILKEIETQLDAFDIYSIFKENLNTILLESGLKDEELGRYSFVGINPFLTFKWQDGLCNINGKKFIGDAFNELSALLDKYKIINETELPFIGGAIGYFSYDLARAIEVLPDLAVKDVEIPQCYFNFYDNVVIIDNQKEKVYISALGILDKSESSIQKIEEIILNSERIIYIPKDEVEQRVESNFCMNEYMDTVEKVREYIKSGDVYITNLTQRLVIATEKNPYEVYNKLRNINPAPFAAFMNLEGFAVVSSSPERFLKIRNGVVETRPIKGTRPRGNTKEEDEKNKLELLESEKDKSELLMIVDLERNDLSKVCKPNSVKVTELFKLEKYSTVYHLVSTIQGELKKSFSSIDCIKACFPGGSITGAPKIRSMEIIEELEPTKRNIYTGCIGYLGFDGNVDLNIVIRTILMKENKAYFGVGGGITWESTKEFEYDETLAKAKALIKALS